MNLSGKKALVVGVANERSMAWAIARHLHEAGAEVGLNYLNESMEKRVRPLGEKINASFIEPCDVSQEDQVDRLFDVVKGKWGHLDYLIHSVAFANREDLANRFIDTSREGFHLALDVSAYSLVSLCRKAEPLMEGREGSVVTLSYLGAERLIQNYNVMGVAKAALESSVRYLSGDLGKKKITINAISAGPVKTLAASGVKDLRSILSAVEEKAPFPENITTDDVGYLATFLCGPGGRHITGSTLYLDSGMHILGAW